MSAVVGTGSRRIQNLLYLTVLLEGRLDFSGYFAEWRPKKGDLMGRPAHYRCAARCVGPNRHPAELSIRVLIQFSAQLK